MKKVGYVIGIVLIMIGSVKGEQSNMSGTNMSGYDIEMVAIPCGGPIKMNQNGSIIHTGGENNSENMMLGGCGLDVHKTSNIKDNNLTEIQQAFNFMLKNEFTSKTNLDEFMPYEFLTREALARFVTKHLRNIESIMTAPMPCSFNDINQADSTLSGFIMQACGYSVMKGSEGNFFPKKLVTRGEIITVISRLLDGDKYDTYGNEFWQDHAQNLLSENIIKVINPHQNIIRNDVALMFYRLSDIVYQKKSEYDSLLKESGLSAPILKPVIYLYPQKKMDIDVKLYLSGDFLVTYPAFDYQFSGWKVIASPDGMLINKSDGEEYSYLFREGGNFNMSITQGFVVAGKDTEQFLKKSLKTLGLTPREYNEFIVYRLPLMKDNMYNAIYFAGTEYTDLAPLEVSPRPDSIQRVFMVFKSLKEKITLKEQILTPFQRTGFAVIERGGTQLR